MGQGLLFQLEKCWCLPCGCQGAMMTSGIISSKTFCRNMLCSGPIGRKVYSQGYAWVGSLLSCLYGYASCLQQPLSRAQNDIHIEVHPHHYHQRKVLRGESERDKFPKSKSRHPQLPALMTSCFAQVEINDRFQQANRQGGIGRASLFIRRHSWVYKVCVVSGVPRQELTWAARSNV